MPYTAAFPKALGTGLLISTPRPIALELCAEIGRFIDEYEHVLSRFRADSLVARIGNAEHGGHFDFPDWAGPLFDLYDALHTATRGAIDPCVGEDLILLGYDPALSFTVEAGAGECLGALHGRAVWGRDVVRSGGTTLVTRGPVHMDFGACGKGYLVDSLGGLLTDSTKAPGSAHQPATSGGKRKSAGPEFVIDAGGDLLVHTNKPIRVALEDPDDPSRAVGVARISDGAFCASAPSRRHWEVAVSEQTHLAIHHLLNAIDGLLANTFHGEWPYTSWGINRDPAAEFTLFFGRTVRVEEIVLYLRADFPHDAWWTQADVTFSDGQTMPVHFQKSGAAQHFAAGGKETDFIRLSRLIKADDPSPFPALTQIEVYGTESGSARP